MALNHSSHYSELTPRQFELVGRLMIEWSNIECLMGVLLSRLLLVPGFPARVFTDEMSAFGLQSATEKALRLHMERYRHRIVSEAVCSDIVAINKEIEALRGTRNRFAHFCWARSTDDEIWGTGLSGALPGSKASRKDYVSLTVQELEAYYERSYSVVERLNAIIAALPEVDEGTALRLCVVSDATEPS